jgi:hypothetical protein
MTGNSSFGLDNDKDTPSSAGYLPSFQRRPTTTLIQSTHPDLDIASPNWGGGEQQLVEVTHHRGKKKKKRQKRQESAMIPTSLQGQVIGAHPNTNPSKFPFTVPLHGLYFSKQKPHQI